MVVVLPERYGCMAAMLWYNKLNRHCIRFVQQQRNLRNLLK